MNEPIEAYMKVGIVHYMAFPQVASGTGPWEETVRHIALDPFFHAVEITHIEDPQARSKVKDIIQLGHLSLGYGAHPAILSQKLNINSLVEEERASACSILKGHIDEAIEMGAESFVVLSGKDPGAKQRGEAVKALIQSLEELCSFSAAKQGPKIVAEIFDCEVDKCCLLGPSSLAREVAQELSKTQNNFGLLVDLSHIPLLNESPVQALTPVKEHLAGIHLGNAVTDPDLPGFGDNHPIFGTPGSCNGVPEVAEFLRTLMAIDFLDGHRKPFVSFEIKPMENQDSLIIIANAKRVLQEAWASI